MGLFDGLPVSPDKGYLREDLSQIDESWAAARFDSLPHVVHILTSKDREGEVRFLKEQSDIVEEVVDEVVHAYHSGFNKAIQNYSQILRLFSESVESIAVLKDDLVDAKMRLSACNKQLHQLWYRSVTLRHIISLLDQIEGIAKVPAHIEKLITEKQFYAAVQLHVQSTLMLEREGLQTVGALQDVRSELTKLRGVLFYKILDELHAHLYNKGEYSSSINENDDEVPTTTAVALSMNNSQPLSQRTRLLKGDNQFGVHGDGLYRPSSIDGGSSFDGHDEDGALAAHDEVRVNGGEGYSKEVKIIPRQMPTWLLYSTPNEFLETMQKSDAPLHVKYLQTMVECLCMLGKVAVVGAMIWFTSTYLCISSSDNQRLRPTIHEVITSRIKAHAKLVNSSRYGVGQTARSVIPGLQFMKGHLESYQLPKQKRQNGISLAGTLLAVSPISHVMAPTGKAQAVAKELLDSILDTVVRIFENHVVVGEILELKSSPSDMNTPKSMSIDGNWNLDSEASQVTGGYSIGLSLTVLQSECQQLICEILRATPEAASVDATVQTARLVSKVPSKGKRDGAEDGLTFAFRFMDGPIIQEGYGSATLLPEQGIYLAASIYRPILQFTDKVASMLPMKYSQLGNDGLLAFSQEPRSHSSSSIPMCKIQLSQALSVTVLKLKKALYGLKQAPRSWNNRINKYFLENNFTKCPYEHALYVKFGLLYSFSNDYKLIGYSDSDCDGDIDDRKSTSGFQLIVTMSSCEAEYVATTSYSSINIHIDCILRYEVECKLRSKVDRKSKWKKSRYTFSESLLWELTVTQYFNILTRYWQQLDMFEIHSWKCFNDSCEIFQLAKHTRHVYPSLPYKPSHSFSMIHSDIWGPS
ncbi:hypothetical protein UlMin_010759 [Ulmus minor]